ncbi:Ribose-phosphate pyrophosphokinase [Granulicella sibirica]|uniref:Ribose-phosphate pyrophosphokinase n=1 Tax=Granulicella sibirica TaxID=2479048 RepID=A0A4Q0T4L7_9BACT|nr:Ribose-phosphate pyrophosphokinase [Granulicella sibirica]
MNEQDTTAVLPQNAGQANETQTGSTPAKQPTTQFVAQSGYQAQTGPPVSSNAQQGGDGGNAKTGAERKRSGRLSDDKRFKIFSGSANRPLAEEVCKFVGVPLGETRLQRFSDGEVHFQLLENVRGADVFLIQPTCFPVDQHLVELLIMMDALKRASAGRVTVVIPYYGYARQDRKDRPRVAITSKLVADLLTSAGANRALLVDLHAAQIQGFFNIPVDHLFASPVLVSHFRDMNLPNLTVVSPDAGGVERARFFAKKLDVPLAIVDKRRTDINVSEVMNVIGDVKGRTCLILDDIIDTAGTLVKTVDALLDQGAEKVYACASHPVLSGPAIERIAASRLEQLVVTNTIPLQPEAQQISKIKVLSIAGLLGRAIESIHMETSVSTLFN